jgi:hypothetical protein
MVKILYSTSATSFKHLLEVLPKETEVQVSYGRGRREWIDI